MGTAESGANIEGRKMYVFGRPAASVMDLIERLVASGLITLVACLVLVIDAITTVTGIALRCAAVVVIVLWVTACLTGVFPVYRWAPSEFPRSDTKPQPPGFEIGLFSNPSAEKLDFAEIEKAWVRGNGSGAHR